MSGPDQPPTPFALWRQACDEAEDGADPGPRYLELLVEHGLVTGKGNE